MDGGKEGAEREDTNLAMAMIAVNALRRQVAELSPNDGEAAPAVNRVHRVRVATRRARSVLKSFRQVLPDDVEGLASELKWIANALSAVRDLDVYEEHFARYRGELSEQDAAALRRFEAHLSRERSNARQAAAEALSSERYTALVLRLRSSCDGAGDDEGEDAPVDDWVVPFVQPYLNAAKSRVLKRGRRIDRGSVPEALHELRKEVKKFRYLIETLMPHLGDALVCARDEAVRLQDMLGAYQDSCVAEARVLEYVARMTGGADPECHAEAFALGRLAELQRQHGLRSRKRFKKRWRAFEAAIARI